MIVLVCLSQFHSHFLDHNGHQGLRKTHPEQSTRKSHRPNFGAFESAKAQSLLNRATESVRYVERCRYDGQAKKNRYCSEPDLLGLQTKESFLAWNDDEQTERMGASMSSLPTTAKATVRTKPFSSSSSSPQTSARNPVIVDIIKNAAYLGKDKALFLELTN